jgi:hypothetical protein
MSPNLRAPEATFKSPTAQIPIIRPTDLPNRVWAFQYLLIQSRDRLSGSNTLTEVVSRDDVTWTCDVNLKNKMVDSDPDCGSIEAFSAGGRLNLSSPESSALPCQASVLVWPDRGPSPSVVYSASDSSWKFSEVCRPGGFVLLRNAVLHAGRPFEVLSVSDSFSWRHRLSAALISRNVMTLGGRGEGESDSVEIVAFECDSHVCEIARGAFSPCQDLRSIAIPASVRLLGR